MKRKFTFLMAAFMLLAFLAVPMGMRGQTPYWSHAFASPEAISNNSITVDGATWTVSTTAGAGSPTISAGNTYSQYGLKFGQNKSNYFGSVTFSTDYFNNYNVQSVAVEILNNGSKAGTLSAQQNQTNIGSTTQTFGTTWTTLTVNTTPGTGGTLSFTYSVEQAFYIHSITVTYTTGGGSGGDTYTVTYNKNGNDVTGAVPTDDNTYNSANNVVTVAGNTDLAKPGHDWSGWCLNSAGTGDVYGPGDNQTHTYTISANTTFYAKWTVRTHTVTLPGNDNYGEYSMSPTSPVAYGTEVTLTYTPATGYENYLASWSVNGTPVSGNSFTMPDEDVTVAVNVISKKVDVLDRDFTGVTGSSYSSWSNKPGSESDAVYAGCSAGGNSSIQLNTNASYGIISTTSGGKVKKVEVSWNINTSSGRKIDIYGKNTAFSSVSDITSGTKIGTIECGTSTELTISNDYKFIGIRAVGGALYLDEIRISWEPNTDVATTTTIDDSGITNTDVYINTNAGSLSATVKDENNVTITSPAVTWSGDNDDVATIDPSTGAVTLVAAGTVTFTANYAGESGSYQPSSDTYEMTVTSSAPYVQPTTIEITPNYTFWGKTAQFSADDFNELSGIKDNVSLNWTRGTGSMFASSTAMRFYKDNTLTFTAPTNYEIKSIVITFSQTQNDLSFSPTGYTLVETTGTWTGSSQTVTMTRPSNASSYAQITSFVITIGAPSSIATPTFSPDGGTYTEVQTVTISCTTDGATIYYTTDGSTPSAVNGTQGTSVTVNMSMTLKAIAIKDEESSAVATAEYTINLPTEYASIAAFKGAFTATSTEVVKITSTLTVVYQHGKDLYVQDNTGGLLVYDKNNHVTGTYENGQTISNIYGTYTKYNGLVEFIPERDLPTPGTGDVVEPIDITELTTSNYSDYESRLVRLSGIMFNADATLSTSGNVENVTMIDNDYNEVVLRNSFKTLAGSIAETDMANVTGFATIYDSHIQLFPRDNNDIQMILSTMDITSDVTIDFAAILESNEIIEIEDGGVLTIGGTFTNNGDLLIDDGGQMKCNSPFIGTIEKSITGYENYTGTGNGGYYLIASPVSASVNSTLVPTNSNDEYQFDDMDFYWFDGQAVGQEWQNPKYDAGNGIIINALQTMVPKKGFLYARKETGVISISADNNNKFHATGTDIVADNLSNVSTTAFGKHNLIGNPYTCNAFVGRAYYRMNPAGDDFTAAAASEPIKPLEGVFIVFGETETADEVTFTTTDPTSLNAGPTNSNISINASKVVTNRGNSNDVLIDRAIVHFGEGQMLPKFMLNPDNTKLYIPQGNKDYAVVRSEARGEMPVNFKAAENGTYTISVEAENLDVNYLHLIDNITGMDVDLLATPSYTFEGKKTDYASRFRLVFDANAGNNEANEEFAFISDGDIIVNGTGTIQVIDILGRQMFSHEVNSAFRIQNSEFAPGVYVLRLINGNNVKTQKIVVK